MNSQPKEGVPISGGREKEHGDGLKEKGFSGGILAKSRRGGTLHNGTRRAEGRARTRGGQKGG